MTIISGRFHIFQVIPAMKTILFPVLMLFALNCCAQDCPSLSAADFPKQDLPPEHISRAVPKNMNSTSYYYGLGVPVDYRMARYLAFKELAGKDENPIGGAAVLLMIYANGYGVQRDIKLCLRLACGNVGGAPAEIEGRKQHLMNLPAKGDAHFDICDDITSGYMMGFCESIATDRNEYRRKGAAKKMQEGWPAKDVAAYSKLRKAATSFFETSSGNEVDMSGTARAAIALDASDSLEAHFLDLVKMANQCSFHNYSQQDFVQADAQLNKTYKKVMGLDKEQAMTGTVTKEGIKQTQRTWIAYRDAWIAFGRVRCPQLSSAALSTLLTLEREAQLTDFAGD